MVDPTALGPAANQWYNNPIPGYFPGPAVAGMNPLQLQGMGDTYDALQGMRENWVPGAFGMLAQGMGGLMDYTQQAGEINPYLDRMADAYTGAAGRALDRMIPQQEMSQVMGGTLGSDRHGIAEGLLRSDANQQLQEQLAGLYSSGYESAANRGLQAWQAIPGAMQSGIGSMGILGNMMTAPGQFMTGAGNTLQAQAQNQLAGEQSRWNYLGQAPGARMNQYAGILGGLNPGGTTTTDNPNSLGMWGGAAAGLSQVPAGIWDNLFAGVGGGGFGANPGYGGFPF